jgi:hypothetical protein
VVETSTAVDPAAPLDAPTLATLAAAAGLVSLLAATGTVVAGLVTAGPRLAGIERADDGDAPAPPR